MRTIGIFDRITSFFTKRLPDGAQISTDHDKTLISKTSPTVWEYEMFRIEWTRRSVLRALYEMMREDTRLKRANHVFASTAVRKGFDLRVTSEVSQKEAAKAQDILNEFMRRVAMNGKLTPWTRVLLRDGDLFLNPVIDPATRLITQIKSLPSITMQRNDDITGNFPDLNSAFQQIDPLSLQPLLELPLWQINHMRWDHEDGERYGRSQYLACLRTWRQLNMSEQDLVIRRRTRAAPKRVHIIGNKERPGTDDEIEEYMARNKLDGSTRDIVTDYFINGMGDVKDLNADAQLDHIADIEHLQEVHMIGTGVPLHILGFGQNVNRDVVEDQKAQFEEDVEELRRIIEFGDGSTYSGIRALFDFQLALQEIDPSILDYNLVWFENNNETANDRVARVTDLRAATPDPLISRKTSLRILAKDLGLDTDDAIEEEIEQIKAEQQEALQEKQAEQNALNPPGTTQPKAATDSTESQGVSMNLKNIDMHSTGNNISFPLHSDPRLLGLEQQVRTRIKGLFGTMAQSYVAKNKKRMAKLADLQPTSTTGALDSFTIHIDPYTQMLMHPDHMCTVRDDSQGQDDEQNQFHVSLLLYPLIAAFLKDSEEFVAPLRELLKNLYMQVGEIARSNLTGSQLALFSSGPLNPDHAPLSPKVVDINVKRLLQQEAEKRADGIIDTTQKLLAKELAKVAEQQKPVEDWVNSANSVIGMPDWRIEMIASTEVANAYNQNLIHAYQELGVHQVRWQALMDDDTCDICKDHNNKVFTLSEVPAIPAHPRCRCVLVQADKPSVPTQ